ncbi:MAG: 6,7-dimethyl-8-ribityllumazine synthase [Chromatiales bacterium]|nr:MAG: 6,7-dimethyl-8-ribityllumazine synthase [Chromatiales bacterium]
MRSIEGNLIVGDARFCVIAARFNEAIVTRLLDGAVDTLRRHGADDSQLHVVRVPGAFELPLAAREAARGRQYDGIIALGAVIRGATPHFDYVCAEAAGGLGRVSTEFGIPVAFGLLTCDTIEQAMERSGTKAGNKGVDAALAAIEMVNLLRQLNA